MNVYDSARMADVVVAKGYAPTENPEDAALIILNTCHIREKAAEKVYSELGRLKPLKDAARRAGRTLLIGVGGCVAQAEGEEIVRRAPHVDIVFGPQTYHRLAGMVARAEAGERVVDTEFPAEAKFDALPASGKPRGAAAFLSVQEGCDKFCTFCVVPYTRGAEYSRPAADLLAEAGRLAAAGVREVTLLGQNVNAWHGAAPAARTGAAKEWHFARLIRALAEIEGIVRIRYTTSHPCDMDDDLIAAHGDVPALMPYLHLPVQSGADEVLAAMNRNYTAADYLSIIERLRAACPDIALASDFIVGFPGETPAAFDATLDLVRAVGFAQAYSFKYSPRPGTPAADHLNQVAEPEKARRLAILQALIGEQALEFNRSCEGTVMEVLFDRPGRHRGQLAGRSPYLQAVHIAADGDQAAALNGRIESVRILEAHANSLAGEIACPSTKLGLTAMGATA
jgi:tRNA-2-methylthio-N6-dimethylallyladenosine synthase